MRTILQVFVSILTATFPTRLVAPAHFTPEPTIPYLIVRSAVRHHVPIDLALHRGWKESGFQNILNHNFQNAWDVGPMQVNSRYHPEVIAMGIEERIDLGVSILGDWNLKCRGNWRCAERAYTRGHIE